MSQQWYEACARRFGGYQKLWESTFIGEDGEAAFTTWLREIIPSHRHVLDVGCGDGLYTLHMSALAEQITGLDCAATMIEHARRHQQSAGISNARFEVWSTRDGSLPGDGQRYDLIYSRRGPTSHLAGARSGLRQGGLVAGIHTGARDVILQRIASSGFRLIRCEEFHGVEVMPTLEDFALFLSRYPGAPDYTHPSVRAELEAKAAEVRTPRGFEVPRWWFLWVAS